MTVRNRATVARPVDLDLAAGDSFEHEWRVELDARSGDYRDDYSTRLACVWRHPVGPYSLRVTYDGVDGWTTLSLDEVVRENEVVGVTAPPARPSGTNSALGFGSAGRYPRSTTAERRRTNPGLQGGPERTQRLL
ncbi:hypothetical protein N0B31_03445 [Salinirubellus salinus]|uniref:Uncharacterized protein n=1 Tax=Salinirubellus salinus TaxID=1364945 RepID=A0A9E7R628_9EURY|nr:hypothetical protein [Salinirubellus salinus]UWM55345.1 hypothetical protein N0B31_03445 [Salinirubellus salinus]